MYILNPGLFLVIYEFADLRKSVSSICKFWVCNKTLRNVVNYIFSEVYPIYIYTKCLPSRSELASVVAGVNNWRDLHIIVLCAMNILVHFVYFLWNTLRNNGKQIYAYCQLIVMLSIEWNLKIFWNFSMVHELRKLLLPPA